jgi:hypothetical protein
MKRLIVLLSILLTIPAFAGAATVADLEKQLNELRAEIEELSERTDATEMHTATDKISWYGDMRVKADTTSQRDVRMLFVAAPGPPPVWATNKYDHNNDIMYTTRLRLGMKAKVWDNVNFSGRLNMYKTWGDSTGVHFMDSLSYTMDGTNSGNPTGDFLRVERAYFDWKNIADSNFYLSIGRRPSTYGPPLHYRENEMRGGTPSGHLMNFNFDGITIGYKLGEVTGMEGQTVRFCYGQGYESGVNNGALMTMSDVEDTHFGGFNIDILNDGTNLLQLTAFRAVDVTDGFTGLAVLPFDVSDFSQADNTFITRMMAQNNIGDIDLIGLGFSRDEDNDIKWFGSFGYTRTHPSGQAGMFGGLLSDPDFSTGVLVHDTADRTERSGYSVYVGAQIPAPMGKFGIEYNYGSQYWTPFNQGGDDALGSKLATRGQVGEVYYIVDVNPKMFIRLAGLYYDYEYSGSGSVVGTPQKVDAVNPMTTHAFFPVVDSAYDINASMTIKF